MLREQEPGKASIPHAKKQNQPIDSFTMTRRNLPHFQEPGRTYFVTFCVRKSDIPEQARQMVFDACLYWDGKKCQVHACVVMPDHVHLLLTPNQKNEDRAFYNLSEILHSIKSYTSHEINKIMNWMGDFWLHETFDRMIRSEDDFSEKWGYIRNNPVKRELVEIVENYPYLYEENRCD